ncbi:pyrroloquinoline quinone biosynthesis peptide chaperone PqqD [Heyndrickxia vini]|uniref:Pyrroloquinoline quinone biosynthesis peptide chaperone PqqD n=1 Tax=Heyndrickxia vini TaxID=1476025 RepID=A0ABX7E782_9BACI|nr:pyrroloquinoline quinone biosynthesis peptide chaperone PqqD [Heyndrickxia vini]
MKSILLRSFPKLAAKARLKFDKVRGKHLLLLPERVVILNETAASILTLCDGSQTVSSMSEKLRASLLKDAEESGIDAKPDLNTMKEDISEFLQEMVEQGWVVISTDDKVNHKKQK